MRTFIIFYLLFSLLSKVSLCKENLIAEFLDNQIDIDVGFTGDKLTYFGALNKPGNIVIIVTGPRKKLKSLKEKKNFVLDKL